MYFERDETVNYNIEMIDNPKQDNRGWISFNDSFRKVLKDDDDLK
jgi:hypothetical protein